MEHVALARHEDAVTVLTVDRPPVNALDLGLLTEIITAVEHAAEDPPGALVIAGREGAFSAGADLKAMPAYGADKRRGMVESINAMALGTYTVPCPVVMAVTGHAIAGGLVLALCGDVRIASSTGRYGLTEVKVGVPYPQAAIGIVKAELTPQAARRLTLNCRLVDAGECVRLGVFDEAVEPAAVLPRALKVAHELAQLPADVYARTKADLRAGAVRELLEAAMADPLMEEGWLR